MGHKRRPIEILLIALAITLLGDVNPVQASWDPPVITGNIQMNITTPEPGTRAIALEVQFRRTAFGAEGAPVLQPAGAGERFCPTCAAESLPDVGDVVYEGVGGTRLNYGDGLDSPILYFEVLSVDEQEGTFWGVALAEDLETPEIIHTYSRSGFFDVSVSTCCVDELTPGDNGIFQAFSEQVEIDSPGLNVDRVEVVWRGLDEASGEWMIFYRDMTEGSDPVILSTTSSDNDNPWVDDNDILWSGLDGSEHRNVYRLSLSDLAGVPEILNPPELVENDYPKIMGDWALATGSDQLGGPKDIWAKNVETEDPAEVINSGVTEDNRVHVAVSQNHALWSGYAIEGSNVRTWWQDLWSPISPVEVSDQGENCSANGDIYHCLRAYSCFSLVSDTRHIFFRTVPIVAENPSIVVSDSSTENQRPALHGVKLIFLDGLLNLYYIDDLLDFDPLTDSPVVLNDADSVPIPPAVHPGPEEAEYAMSADWVTWAGTDDEDVDRLFARFVADFPSSPVVLASGTGTQVSQPSIGWGHVAWRGFDEETEQFEVYLTDLDDLSTPARVSDDSSVDNELPKVIVTLQAPEPSMSLLVLTALGMLVALRHRATVT